MAPDAMVQDLGVVQAVRGKLRVFTTGLARGFASFNLFFRSLSPLFSFPVESCHLSLPIVQFFHIFHLSITIKIKTPPLFTLFFRKPPNTANHFSSDSTNRLFKEEQGGNWLYSIDQLAPLEI